MENIDHQARSNIQARPIIIDSEHFAIRLLVPILMIGLIVIAHLLGTWVLSSTIGDDTSPLCLVLIGDVIVLLLGGFFLERGLKRLLPSRRSAVLSQSQLVVTDKRVKPPSTMTIDWQQRVNVKAWRFEVMRQTRVRKGWYCMALQLLQDEQSVILYTFMSPEVAQAAIGFNNFIRLRPRKETESNRELTAAAEQRRLLTLEDARWQDGAEINQEDFKAVLETLQRTVPGWL